MPYPQYEQRVYSPEQKSFLSTNVYSSEAVFRVYSQDSTNLVIVRPELWRLGRFRAKVLTEKAGTLTVQTATQGGGWTAGIVKSWSDPGTGFYIVTVEDEGFIMDELAIGIKALASQAETFYLEFLPENRQ